MQKEWSHIKVGGFSLVEIILASALFALLLTGLVGGYLYGQESTVLAGNRVRATLLAEEGLEAARNIRDSQFRTDLTLGTYGLATTSNIWNLALAPDVSDIFSRQVVITRLDTKRKLVTSTVTWQQNPQRTGSVALTTYLTHWMSDWRSSLIESTVDIPGTGDGSQIIVQGDYAYMVFLSGSPDLYIINISDPENPVVTGTYTVSSVATGLSISGNYLYVSSQDNAEELKVFDVSDPTNPVKVGAYDAPGTANARGVFAVGTTVYFVEDSNGGNEFFIIDASDPTNPVLLGSLNLGNTGYEVWVSGNYAYIASSFNTQELMVVNISNPAAPALTGPGLNASGNTDAITVTGAGNIVFIGQGTAIRIINIANPLLPALLGTFTAAGTVTDIAIRLSRDNTYLYYVTTNSTGEFGIVDVTNPASPTLVDSLNLTTLNGVAYDPITDRAYVVGIDNAAEFHAITPF